MLSSFGGKTDQTECAADPAGAAGGGWVSRQTFVQNSASVCWWLAENLTGILTTLQYENGYTQRNPGKVIPKCRKPATCLHKFI